MKSILDTFKRIIGISVVNTKIMPKNTFNDVIQGKCNASCENCVCVTNKQHFKL